jgi:hypothetical protein
VRVNVFARLSWFVQVIQQLAHGLAALEDRADHRPHCSVASSNGPVTFIVQVTAGARSGPGATAACGRAAA